MSHFADRLVAAVQAKGNPVCAGLDPHLDQLPRALREEAERAHGQTPRAAAEAILKFNRALLDALSDCVPVCKPQIAFYEEFGAEGIRAYAETIRYAQGKGLLAISDAKRGDIGTTAEAYARAHLSGASGGFDADAVTVNPYLGADSLAPFVKAAAAGGKGVFVLVRTSNPGAGDLQDLEVAARPAAGHDRKEASGSRPIYEHVACLVRDLGTGHCGASGFSAIGAVVGATYPAQAQRLRELLPETLFLVPGYGAQGATARDVAAAFRADGLGAIVNSSRGIIFAYRQAPYAARFGEARFAEAARAAALDMAEELRKALPRLG